MLIRGALDGTKLQGGYTRPRPASWNQRLKSNLRSICEAQFRSLRREARPGAFHSPVPALTAAVTAARQRFIGLGPAVADGRPACTRPRERISCSRNLLHGSKTQVAGFKILTLEGKLLPDFPGELPCLIRP